jgi:hypothetical protein
MNMSKREKEHYEIAKMFGVGRPFTRFEFYSLYWQEYPKRRSTPIPSDFCINLSPKGAESFPNSSVGSAAVYTSSSDTVAQLTGNRRIGRRDEVLRTILQVDRCVITLTVPCVPRARHSLAIWHQKAPTIFESILVHEIVDRAHICGTSWRSSC